MTFIRNRTDISDWLIHFVRDRDPEVDDPFGDEVPPTPGLEPDAPAASVLRSIINTGGLLPSFSLRNGRTTVYGGAPVVCFTEAPIYDFVRYVTDRNESSRCSHFGVCLPKAQVFAAGGRPVIYGLTSGNPPLIEDTTYTRVIEPEVLSRAEQYRYVAYDPTRSRPLDWTHEREWRWTPRDCDAHRLWCEGPNGFDEYPGLPLFRPKSDGGFFSRIGFLVRRRQEASELAETLLALADAGGNGWAAEYSRTLLRNAFVVPLEEVESRNVHRVEELADDMRVLATRDVASPKLIAEVRRRIKEAEHVGSTAAAKFMESAKRHPGGLVHDVVGGAWVITHGATSKVTDALLRTKLAESMAGQYYTVDLHMAIPDQAQSVHTAAADAAADYLTRKLGQRFYTRGWID